MLIYLRHILSLVFIMAVLAQVTKARATNDMDEELHIGESYISQGDPNRAIWWLNGVIDQNRNNAKAYLLRAEAYLLIDRYPLAYEDFQKAILIDPGIVDALMFKKKNTRRVDDFSTVGFDNINIDDKTVSSELDSSNKWFEDE